MTSPTVPTRLLRSWRLAAVVYPLGLAMPGGVLLAAGVSPGRLLGAAGIAAVPLIGLVARARALLPENRRGPSDPPDPTLGAANWITVLRGLPLGLLVGFIVLEPSRVPGAPFLLFSLAVLADYADGLAARVTGRLTRFGEAMDTAVDGVAVLAAAAVLVSRGVMAPWFVLVGTARYLYLGGLWLRRATGSRTVPLKSLPSGRFLAGAVMALEAVALAPGHSRRGGSGSPRPWYPFRSFWVSSATGSGNRVWSRWSTGRPAVFIRR